MGYSLRFLGCMLGSISGMVNGTRLSVIGYSRLSKYLRMGSFKLFQKLLRALKLSLMRLPTVG